MILVRCGGRDILVYRYGDLKSKISGVECVPWGNETLCGGGI